MDILQIEETVRAEQPLSVEQGIWLFENAPLDKLREMADSFKQRLYGENVFFVNNRQINYTNICVLHCKFCAFAETSKDSPGAYDWSLEQIEEKAGEAIQQGARELHIVGGLHPDHDFEYYLEMIGRLRKAFPEVNLKAFTAVEIYHFSHISGLPVDQVLTRLREAGLQALTGGGAEILGERVRKQICGPKETGEQWLQAHRTAHQMGIHSNATMLFGHLENIEDRVEHMNYLRELQAETGGFYSFIPLVFHPENTNLRHKIPEKTSVEDRLRTIAVSRLFLHNIPHIKAYWVQLGLEVAREALHFGASDLDGTIREEKITWAAGSETSAGLTLTELEGMIRAEGLVPVERDALYNTYTS